MAAEQIIAVASALEAAEDSMDVDGQSWLNSDERVDLMRKRGRPAEEEEMMIPERDPSYVLGSEDIQMYVADAVAGNQQMEAVLAAVSRDWRHAIRRSIRKRRARHGFPALCADAAARGDLSTLVWLWKHGAAWDKATCEAAARGGHLWVLQIATRMGCPWSPDAATEAARGGHLEVVEWILRTNKPCILDRVGYEAAGNGHLEILRWLRATNTPFGPYLLHFAARSGNLDVVKWTIANQGLRFFVGQGLEEAVWIGNLEVVRYLHEHGMPWNELCGYAAARVGNLEVLLWADGEGLLIRGAADPFIVEAAVEKGNLALVNFLVSKGFALETERLCWKAAKSGSLEMMTWVRDDADADWDERTCTEAARGGHLEMLQWCRERGCPWDENTCRTAASGGYLEVLQWAHANGCPWDVSACSAAAYEGHLIVLQWLRANGCPWDETTTTQAARNDQLEVLQWARSEGCPWNSNVLRYGVGEALIWARANGAPPVPNEPSDVIQFGVGEALIWAQANGAPPVPNDADSHDSDDEQE